MKDIEFPRSRIVEVKHNLAKVNAGTVPTALKVVALMSSEIATAINSRWLLFDKERDVKNGFAEVVLDLELNNVRVVFSTPKIDPLDFYAERVSKFKVFTKGDNKKKGKRLLVSFLVYFTGSPFHLLEYLLKVGGIEGTCKLTPRQEELFTKTSGTVANAESSASIYEDNGWTARIEVKEMQGGMFAMTRRAACPTKKLKQGPPADFASENEAREAGAAQIQEWADKIRLGGVKKEKTEAAKLVEWCAKFISPQMAIAGIAPEAVQ